jgi:cytoskeletal protein RodZ
MSESVGSKLRQARQERSLTLEQAAQATHIRQRYLQALEEEDFGAMPSHVQVRGFLRSYAGYLGLNANELMALLHQSGSSAAPSSPPPVTPPAQSDQSVLQAQAIYKEIGRTISERRDLLSLTVQEIEQQTRIPKRYLILIENGEFERFPSPVQARGMLGNYAKFLDMDTDSVLLRYAEGIQSKFAAAREAEPQPAKPTPRRRPRLPLWLRNVVSADLLFVSILGASIVFFFFWGINRITATRSSQVEAPTAPSIADVLLPSNTPEPSATAPPALLDFDVDAALTADAQDQLDPGAATPAAIPGVVNITLVVRQRTWVRVTVDGQVEFDGRVAPGDTLTFSADEQIELLTGNGASLQVFFNDQDLGLMGVLGEVVNVIFTEFGSAAPTPTTVPTATPTPPIMPTPTSAPPAE